MAFIVRLRNRECHPHISLTRHVVGAGSPDSQTGCVLLDSNPIIFLDYILLFISETSESMTHAPGCCFVLNPCLTAVVILTLIRAYKHRTHDSPFSHVVNPNSSIQCATRARGGFTNCTSAVRVLECYNFPVYLISRQAFSSTSTC